VLNVADYSQDVESDQLDQALRLGGFDAVMHYLSGANALRLASPLVVQQIRDMGWRQAGIDVPLLTTIDGEFAARMARAYGFGPGFRLYLDIEPDEFARDPGSWPAAADAWCDAVRAAGMSPGVYGNDVTVAACCNHADTIWRAKPGMCDPEGPGLAATFFPGYRMVQCDQVTFGGVEFDVSVSEFDVGPVPPPPPPVEVPAGPLEWWGAGSG
jgi:hypothetical protein